MAENVQHYRYSVYGRNIIEEGNNIGKLHGKICPLEKTETLYDTNEGRLALMKY